jgi:hypothetical protein
MKYALIKDGQVIQIRDFGEQTPPDLNPVKGKWLPYTEEPYPEVSDSQIAESVTAITQSGVNLYWSIRAKTDLEKWEQPDYRLKIVAPIELFNTMDGQLIILWYNLMKLPYETKGELVHLYCNRVDRRHVAYVSQLISAGLIEVWERNEENVIRIYTIAEV